MLVHFLGKFIFIGLDSLKNILGTFAKLKQRFILFYFFDVYSTHPPTCLSFFFYQVVFVRIDLKLL